VSTDTPLILYSTKGLKIMKLNRLV